MENKKIKELRKENMKLKRQLKMLDLLSHSLPLFEHDIRNKLVVIKGYTDFIENGLPLNERQIKSMVDHCEKMEVLSGILGGFLKNEEWVDAEDCFKKAVLSSPELGENVKIKNNLANLNIFVNESMLIQIFHNFIDDSRIHNPEQQSITIEAGYTKTPKGRFRLFYRDNGIGVHKDEKEKIFIEGYGNRTGKGLALIKELCNVNNFDISERGTYGSGVKFIIFIPKRKWKIID